MWGRTRQVVATFGSLALFGALRAGAAPLPAAVEFAPDRFHFAPLEVTKVGREIPFTYDAPGAAKHAMNDPNATYETCIGLGLQTLREQDFNVAVDCFRAAIAKSNDAPATVSHLLARALLLDGRPREADKVWEELCRRDPKDAEAQWQTGYSLFLQDDLDGAMSRWNALEALAPAHPFPPLMIGLVDWSLNQMPEAEREIINATRRSKAPAQAFLALAAIACASGDIPEAVGWIRRGFDRLAPAEQHRWYARPQFDALRHSGHPLVAKLEEEFQLNRNLTADAADANLSREGFDITIDHTFGASMDFAPFREVSGTNGPPMVDGLHVLRLAPRIVPK